jgi:hypothetical protein
LQGSRKSYTAGWETQCDEPHSGGSRFGGWSSRQSLVLQGAVLVPSFEIFISYINALTGMHGYVLPEPRKAVKGLFVAVPQIERNRTAQQRPPLKPKRPKGATDEAALFISDQE